MNAGVHQLERLRPLVRLFRIVLLSHLPDLPLAVALVSERLVLDVVRFGMSALTAGVRLVGILRRVAVLKPAQGYTTPPHLRQFLARRHNGDGASTDSPSFSVPAPVFRAM